FEGCRSGANLGSVRSTSAADSKVSYVCVAHGQELRIHEPREKYAGCGVPYYSEVRPGRYCGVRRTSEWEHWCRLPIFLQPGRKTICSATRGHSMDNPCRYAHRPLRLMARYIAMRPYCHGAILVTVLAAVGCSVSAQYGVKFLVDTLSGLHSADEAWLASPLLVGLIVADNLLWRVASWIASHTFVGVTGDLRRDLFRHLTGHAPSYFADRLPGTVSSRVTATSNAVFTIENMTMWNVLPPCVATLVAILWVGTVSLPLAAALAFVSAVLVCVMFRLAAAGRTVHHEFADKAAAVDGEMIDIIGNMPIVWAFGGIGREQRRFEGTVEREVSARRR